MRLQIWQDSLAMLLTTLPFGSGAGTFARAYSAWGSHGYGTVSHAHSEPLHFLIEGGVFAGLGMLVFLIWFLRMEKRLRGMFYGLWLGVAGILFHSTIDFQLHIPALTLLFGGSCIVLYAEVTQGRSASVALPRWLYGAMLAVQVMGISFAVAHMQVSRSMHALSMDLTDAEHELWQTKLRCWDVSGQHWAMVRLQSRIDTQSPDEMRALALSAVNAFPHHGEVLRTAGFALLRDGFVVDAHDVALQAMKWQPTDYRTHVLRSVIAEQKNQAALAIDAWGEALAVWPPVSTRQPILHALKLNPIGLLWLGSLEHAHPHWSERLGDEMMRRTDFDTAVLAYEQVFERRAMQWDIPQYGLALVYSGQVEDGLSELARMSLRYPNAPWVVRQEALAFTALARYDEAASVWMRVAEIGQGDEALQQCMDVLDRAIVDAAPDELRRLRQKKARCARVSAV